MSDNPSKSIFKDAGKHIDECIDIYDSLMYITKHLGKLEIEFIDCGEFSEWHVSVGRFPLNNTHVRSPDLAKALKLLSGRDIHGSPDTSGDH